MKRLIGLGIAMVFLFCGCISFEVGNTEKELVAKIAARHVGFEVEKRYPDIAEEIAALSQGILIAEENELITIMVDRIISILANEVIDDSLLILDIQDLTSLIQIKPDAEITKDQMALIRAVAEGLTSGIERR